MVANRNLLKGRRILFVFGCLDLGGSERQGLLLGRYLKDTCHADVRVLALSRKPGRVSELCDEYGIPWEGMGFRWSRIRPHRVWELFRLSRHLKKNSAEILMPYYTLPNVACGLVWRYSSARLCIWNQRDHGLLLTGNPWHRTAVGKTPVFISNSECGMDFLRKSYDLSGKPTHVIHNGIVLSPPEADREQWRSRLGLPANAFAACMLANLGPYKDHLTLARAWQEVSEYATSKGRKAFLLLAGKMDGRVTGLQHLIDELGLTDNIRLLGMVNDVSGLLHASDLCVHSAISEGCPNAVLEAMAAGLPVAGTDIPGIREAVGAEGASFLTPVGDHVGMAEKIKLLMADPELRKSYGSALRNRVKSEFSVERMCTASVQIINNSLATAMNPERQKRSQ